MKVGIGERDYGYKRLTYGLPVKDVTYTKPVYVPWKWVDSEDPRLRNTYLFNPASNVNLFHLWNGVCLNRKPWIMSVESHLPRHPSPEYRSGFWHKMCWRAIASDYCKLILPFSEFSKQFLLWQNKNKIDSNISSKTKVFYGGVKVDKNGLKNHKKFLEKSNEFRVVFVGHDFFRKGGVPLLRAFDRLRNELPDLQLRIISRVSRDGYVTNVVSEMVNRIRVRLEQDEDIEWYESLPHDEVLNKLETSHVATLATLDDQFPWSPVEAMSRGLPVIASNVTSLPEQIQHGHNGYLIDLPKHENGRWSGMMIPNESSERQSAVEEAYELLTDGLEKYIRKLYVDEIILHEMGVSAAKHVANKHDPHDQAYKLKKMYESVI
jgi:glycosyltransferase involved in cell wall biosynthesis